LKDRIALLATLEYPSDRLTIGDLRQKFPDTFDQPGRANDLSACPFLHDDHGPGFGARDKLYVLLDGERQVALNALVEAQGQTRDDEYQSPQDERQELAKLYQEYGVAQGPEHAKQLIRDLEASAVMLAKGRARS